MSRSFLVLQGTASPFFSRLSDALRTRDHKIHRVNFCGGDVLYAGTGQASNYRGSQELLPAWYRQIIEMHGCTDILLFGDCRAIHRPMHALAEEFGVRVHVFEEGYIRPYWITMESHGVNGRSLLPSTPQWYLDQRKYTPRSAPSQPTGYNVRERAFHDMTYRVANAVYAHRFPHYKTHRPHNGVQEYAGLARRMAMQRGYEREAGDVTVDLLAHKRPYYLFPLQLNSDSQIVDHSPFDGICDAISVVLHSFARNAPANSWLVLKNHPLDTGLIGFRRFATGVAKQLGISERLRFIDAGHLPTLLEHSRGVIVVNSTVGLSAIHHGRPLVSLGSAIYSMEGLTWQGRLADFWTQAKSPDIRLYQAFRDYVMHHTQINGDFYTKTGIAMSVEGAIARLEAARD